jgi:hypothetical protein
MPHSSKLKDDRVMYIFMSQFTPMFKDTRTRNEWNRMLAESMGVSPKTIRDIWSGRTWTHITLSPRPSAGSSIDADLFGWELFPMLRPALNDPFAFDMMATGVHY